MREGDNGNTSFIICDASQPGKTYNAGTVPGSVSSLKVYVIKPGMVAVAVAAQANPDGTLHNHKRALGLYIADGNLFICREGKQIILVIPRTGCECIAVITRRAIEHHDELTLQTITDLASRLEG